MDLLRGYLEQHELSPWLVELILGVALLFLAWLSYLLAKFILTRVVTRIVDRTRTDYDDILLNEGLLNRVSSLIPLAVIHEFAHYMPIAEGLTLRITEALMGLVIMLAAGNGINSLLQLFNRSEKMRNKPIKGYFQILKIIVYIWGVIIIFGMITGQNPWDLLAGLGALTAVIILIFKDTILSFVASLQISSYDLVAVGDWITFPKYGADGDVIDIALHTVKVQNFDKTITVIPTYKLVEDAYKNWRGMQQTGGRRIMRAINIDLSSIKFCDDEMLQRFEEFTLLKDYLAKKKKDIQEWNDKLHLEGEQKLLNGRRLTNIGTFRAYVAAYLQNRDDIHKDFTFLIRQLEAGSEGVPLQIYVFTTTTVWTEYEAIQADIFDHLFAIMPRFELKVFQYPTGSDIRDGGALLPPRAKKDEEE